MSAETFDVGLTRLNRLRDELRRSLSVSPPRSAVIQALEATIEFVNSHPAFEEAGISAPLHALQFALHDLENGVVAPIIAPINIGENRHADPKAKKIMKAYAISCVDHLMEKGSDETQACRFVSKAIEEAGFPIKVKKDSISWKTVKYWRKDITRLSAERDQDLNLLKALRAESPFSAAQSIAEARKDVAIRLSRMVLLVGRYAVD